PTHPPTTSQPALNPQPQPNPAGFEKLLAQQPAPPTTNVPPPHPAAGPHPAGVDPRRAVVRRLIRETHPHPCTTQDLWTVLNTQFGDRWDRTVVTNWLTEDVRAGLIHRTGKGRYVHGPAPTQTNPGDQTP
ncbi:hypothetical protein ACFXPF_16740, partial [Streptomyces sp. NPDC059131]